MTGKREVIPRVSRLPRIWPFVGRVGLAASSGVDHSENGVPGTKIATNKTEAATAKRITGMLRRIGLTATTFLSECNGKRGGTAKSPTQDAKLLSAPEFSISIRPRGSKIGPAHAIKRAALHRVNSRRTTRERHSGVFALTTK